MKTSQRRILENGGEGSTSSPADSHASLFPTQGSGGGRNDDRYLWPQMLRVIDEVRPTWVVGENVAGITTMVEGGVLTHLGYETTLFGEGEGLHRYELRQPFTIERVCKDLENLGYSVQPVLIPAAAVGAPHRRDRIFIIAYASDAYGGDDLRTSGEDEGKGKGKGLSEWHSIWEPGESDQLRPAVQRIAEDSICDGRVQRDDDQQGCERNERDTCSRNTERLCAEERVDPSYTNSRRSGEVSAEIHAGFADGAESFSAWGEHDAADPSSEMCDRGSAQTGREWEADSNDKEYSLQPSIIGSCKERIATHANCQRREESVKPGREEDSKETRERMDHRIERSRCDGYSPNSFCAGLPASLQPGCNDKEKWNGSRRPTLLTPDDAWIKGTWWDNFPTVPPVHSGNDGLPIRMDGISLPASMWPRSFRNSSPDKFQFGKWRTEALKAYGNAIVPQVMYEIFRAIQEIES